MFSEASPPSGRVVRGLAALALVSLTVGACSTSGGNSSSTTVSETTVEQPGSTTDTTSPDDPAPTTEPAGPAEGEITVADLEALLPTADEVGFGFREVAIDESEADPAVDAAMRAACPDATRFIDDSEDGATAKREFEDSEGRSVGVELNPSPRNMDDDVLDEIIDAMNSCDEIRYTASNRAEVTMVITAERADDLGDRGVLLRQDVTMAHPSLADEVELSIAGWIYLFDTVGVEVQVMDGVDNDGTVHPADFEVVNDIALQLSMDLERLFED